MAQGLRALPALGEDSRWVPSTDVGRSQVPVTPAPGDPALLTSMGIYSHRHLPTSRHRTEKNINKSLSKAEEVFYSVVVLVTGDLQIDKRQMDRRLHVEAFTRGKWRWRKGLTEVCLLFLLRVIDL